ncbi:DNA repair protein RecO [Marinomonas gallaica]|uniref:DNA repair protein RecO n=1 Tax=Marinomonas gallaica TaxID=1806667 RepID=A0A1C3JMV2_9GAMM|nr:DNA repair protein RecO [Marinomonas gallaica]SBT16499.1 DNA repair protein RecO [Marinomonas gallaica]SBT20215.1 DNA repair protein RecO [Marinomonas gallaica]
MRVQGYIIHTRPFQDEKVLLDILTKEAGLIRSVWRKKAKEARVSPGSFLLMEFELSGRSELKSVRSAEALESPILLQGNALYSAFYVHELIERLLPVGLPLEPLFVLYRWLITHLQGEAPIAPLLRRFELGVFEELGIQVNMSATSRGEPLESQQLYQLHHRFGLRPYYGEQPKVKPIVYLDGAAALAYAEGRWDNRQVLMLAKELHRAWLDHALGARVLKSRSLLPSKPYDGERLWHVPLFRFSV